MTPKPKPKPKNLLPKIPVLTTAKNTRTLLTVSSEACHKRPSVMTAIDTKALTSCES